MGTIGNISDAINLIDVKKESLRKSFLDLQSQSPSSLDSLNLKWSDLDSYFTSLSSSLHNKFHLLQTLNSASDNTSILARPELKSFCINSDGLGLRQFIILASDRLSILAELPDAYRCAPNAAAMVLDAVEGFYGDYHPGANRADHGSVRISCTMMLEALMRMKPDVKPELMEKAMKLAVEWNQKMVSRRNKGKDHEALGFLLLVVAYRLIDRFSIDELMNCFIIASKRPQAVYLCRQLIPANKINDLIQKLINQDKQVLAVRYIIEFQKTDEFPPVRLLEDRKLKSMKTVENIPKIKSIRNQNVVMSKQIEILKSIIRCIEDYHLQSKYPKDTVVNLIKKLENQMATKKLENQVVTKKVENQAGTKKPENQAGTKKLENQAGTKKPENQAGTKKLENQVVTKKLENQVVSSSKLTVKQPVFKKQKPKKQKNSKFVKGGTSSAVPMTSIQNVMQYSQAPAMSVQNVMGYSQQAPAMSVQDAGSIVNTLAALLQNGLTGANIGYNNGNQMSGGPSFYQPDYYPQ